MPECYADTLLIEALVPSKTGYNHQMGCFKVEAQMTKGRLKDGFAVGIIDNDKRQIKYLNEFEEVDRLEDSLILWKHKRKVHFVIQISPALESWMLKVCRNGGIEIEKFGISGDLTELKKYTKSQTSLKDEKLIKLFKQIAALEGVAEVKKLRNWIELLKENNYRVDIKDLKNA